MLRDDAITCIAPQRNGHVERKRGDAMPVYTRQLPEQLKIMQVILTILVNSSVPDPDPK